MNLNGTILLIFKKKVIIIYNYGKTIHHFTIKTKK